MTAIRANLPSSASDWPPLPFEAWKDTCSTLHMWTQIAGKVRLALTPLVNHWWNTPLYLSARGLTTSPMPYRDHVVEIEFDFIDHQLLIRLDDGRAKSLPLAPRPTADFYKEFMAALHFLGIDVKIWPVPVEVPNPVRFDQDFVHASYDPESAHRFWRILLSVDTVLKIFRASFVGKCSPVHFFWGSFDLCVTRFSGRPAPPKAGADSITREAYSHEVSSAGFWPGGGNITGAAFYSYAAPQPEGFADARVRPVSAFYHRDLGEFLLMYEDVRSAADPPAVLLEFLQSTYEAAANLAHWDRAALERSPAPG
ncbi:MAG: DUF5996 family protein [Candidatus Acidiferrum sp.]